VSKNIPKIAPTTDKERDTYESVVGIEARVAKIEALPWTIDAEIHVLDATVTSVASRHEINHNLGRKPVGAIMIAQGSDKGIGLDTDVILTLSLGGSTARTAAIWLRKTVDAGPTVRRYRFLLF
jgi:hypothetical protein